MFQTRLDQIRRLSGGIDVDVPNSVELYRPVGLRLTPSRLDSTPMADEMASDVRRVFSQKPSIFLHIIEQMRDTHSRDTSELTPNRFVMSTMAWKYSQGLTDGLDYLIQHFNLRGFNEDGEAFGPQYKPEYLLSGLDMVYSRIAADDFYSTLLVQLFHDCGFPVPSDRFHSYGSQPKNRRGSVDILSRKTAYLAYQLMRPWRDFYRSHLELEALFWAQYRHLLFFVFPSTENLARCLPWYRPTASMHLHDHPGYIDFLLWPQLHEQLKCSWKNYNTEGLVENLIRGFNVSSADIDPEQPQIYVKNSELHLSEAFERALADASNFCMQPHLFARSSGVARRDSTTVPDASATGQSAHSTHTAGGALDTNVRPYCYELGQSIWTTPLLSDSHLPYSTTNTIPLCPPQLDNEMVQSNEGLNMGYNRTDFLDWDDYQMGSDNFFMDAGGEI
ncbi:hypothetical protein AbraCBS73388_006755 [Aspergillus brasiliensis]|uniref:Transcription factor domain-containing protein n=1 Tax=Aspergillus brasiliensis TaxID=319629 RepID=A0A9W6DUU0_9EURO|nr:hypothetical protein AbraCBS73388_006755 [Aspergillus brasiliensis]